MIPAALAFLAAASAAARIVLIAPEPGERRPRAARRARAAPARCGARLGGEDHGRAPRAGLAAGPTDLAARIEAAGRPAGLGVRELTAAKLAGAGVAGVSVRPWARSRRGGSVSS